MCRTDRGRSGKRVGGPVVSRSGCVISRKHPAAAARSLANLWCWQPSGLWGVASRSGIRLRSAFPGRELSLRNPIPTPADLVADSVATKTLPVRISAASMGGRPGEPHCSKLLRLRGSKAQAAYMRPVRLRQFCEGRFCALLPVRWRKLHLRRMAGKSGSGPRPRLPKVGKAQLAAPESPPPSTAMSRWVLVSELYRPAFFRG